MRAAALGSLLCKLAAAEEIAAPTCLLMMAWLLCSLYLHLCIPLRSVTHSRAACMRCCRPMYPRPGLLSEDTVL